jgi:hypothetical protein
MNDDEREPWWWHDTVRYYETVRRYTIRIWLEPRAGTVEYRAVTSLGELKAAAMAADRLMADQPEARYSGIEVTNVETEFVIEDRDLLDYWGGID